MVRQENQLIAAIANVQAAGAIITGFQGERKLKKCSGDI
jgi:hypothetical protein